MSFGDQADKLYSHDESDAPVSRPPRPHMTTTIEQRLSEIETGWTPKAVMELLGAEYQPPLKSLQSVAIAHNDIEAALCKALRRALQGGGDYEADIAEILRKKSPS